MGMARLTSRAKPGKKCRFDFRFSELPYLPYFYYDLLTMVACPNENEIVSTKKVEKWKKERNVGDNTIFPENRILAFDLMFSLLFIPNLECWNKGLPDGQQLFEANVNIPR